ELVIFRFTLYRDKRLKARVLPEAVRFARRSRRRGPKTRQICLESVRGNKRVILRPNRGPFDFLDSLGGRFRMAREHGLVGEGGHHRGAVAPLYLILVTNIQNEVAGIRDWRSGQEWFRIDRLLSVSRMKDFEFNVQRK